MKKIVSFIILSILALMVSIQPTYAEATTQIKNDFTWGLSNDGTVMSLRSQRKEINFSDIFIQIDTAYYEYDYLFVPDAQGIHSRVYIYETPTSSIPLKSYDFEHEVPEATDVMYMMENDNPYLNFQSHIGLYMQIVLVMNPLVTSGNAHFEGPGSQFQYWFYEYPELHHFSILVGYEIIYNATIADFPETSGSPYGEGELGTVLDWNYNETTDTFSGSLLYNQRFFFTIPGVTFGSDDFLENVESVQYYSYEDEKFFLFTYTGSEEVLTAANPEAAAWSGFAIWNLTTNELVSYNKARALTYIEVLPNRDMFAYLYLDQIPVDEILTVSGFVDYRYIKNNFSTLWRTVYGDWNRHNFYLEADAETYGFVDSTLPQWALDIMYYSSAAGIAAGILGMFVPGLQPIAFKLLAMSFALAVTTEVVGGLTTVIQGQTDEIQTISPTTSLRATLNSHFALASNSAYYLLPSDATVSKLYLGNFSQIGTDYVEPNGDTFTYTEISWITNGKVYVLDEKVIDTQAIVDQDYLDSLPEEDPNFWDLLAKYGTIVIVVVGIIAVMILLPIIEKASTSLKRLVSEPRKLFIFAIFVVIVLIMTGVIRI